MSDAAEIAALNAIDELDDTAKFLRHYADELRKLNDPMSRYAKSRIEEIAGLMCQRAITIESLMRTIRLNLNDSE